MLNKLNFMFKNQKYHKFIVILLGLIAFASYFVGALSFQVIQDFSATPLLIASTTLSILSACLIVIGYLLYKQYHVKMSTIQISLLIITIFVFVILAIIGIIFGTIEYLRFH